MSEGTDVPSGKLPNDGAHNNNMLISQKAIQDIRLVAINPFD